MSEGRSSGRKRAAGAMLEERSIRNPQLLLWDQPWAALGDACLSANDRNAHPHSRRARGGTSVAVVLQRGDENHAALLAELTAEVIPHFLSQTDTEVIAHLDRSRARGRGWPALGGLVPALPQPSTPYGLAVVSPRCPGQVIGASASRSPWSWGWGKGSISWPAMPPGYRASYGEGRLSPGWGGRSARSRRLRDPASRRGLITPRIDRIDWKPDAVELGRHAHYMLKEIHEQPETIHDACRGRLRRAEGPRSLRRSELDLEAAPPSAGSIRCLRHELYRVRWSASP